MKLSDFMCQEFLHKIYHKILAATEWYTRYICLRSVTAIPSSKDIVLIRLKFCIESMDLVPQLFEHFCKSMRFDFGSI